MTQPDDDLQSPGHETHSPDGVSKVDWKQELISIIEKGDDAATVEQLLDGRTDLDLDATFPYEFPQQDTGPEPGVTFLMLAGGLDRAGVVEVLWWKGSKIHTKTEKCRMTVLLYAAQENVSIRTFDLLIRTGGLLLVEKTNRTGMSSLHFAARNGNPDMIRSLLAAAERSPADGASLLRQRDDNRWTALHHAAFGSHSKAVDVLLDHQADAYAQDNAGRTPLHLAARNGDHAVTETLMDKNAETLSLLKQSDKIGWTALHFAALSGAPGVIDLLLGRGADLYAIADDGSTALHLAAFQGDVATIQTLLAKLDEDFSSMNESPFEEQRHEARERRRRFISAQTTLGDSALSLAALSAHTSLVLEILESTVLFLSDPDQHEPYLSSPREVDTVSVLLLEVVDSPGPSRSDLHIESTNDLEYPSGMRDEMATSIENHTAAILVWAILNRQEAVLNKYVAASQTLPKLNWPGRSWAAVTTLVPDIAIIETILTFEYRGTALDDDNAISLLRLAIQKRNLAFVQALLCWLGGESNSGRHAGDQQSTRSERFDEIPTIPPLRAMKILLNDRDSEHNLISLCAQGGTSIHRDIESYLWKILNKSLARDRSHFLNLGEEHQDQILELAARYGTPGDEGYLIHYLQYLLPAPSTDSVLQRAVALKKPVVLWWLLSNGEYPTEADINHAEKQAETWRKDDFKGQIILDLLADPPPIRQTRAPADDHHEPNFEHASSDFDSPLGTVLDFFRDDDEEYNRVLYQLKHCSVIDIVYTRGPKAIMRPCKYRKVTTLRDALEHRLQADGVGFEFKNNSGHQYPGSLDHELKEYQTGHRAPVVRWVHIPACNLRCMKELLVRMSKDKGLMNKDHRPLASFIDTNQAQINAGGRKTYMKPQYVAPGAVDHSKEAKSTQHASALYMPFLGWSNWPRKPDQKDLRQCSHNPYQSSYDPAFEEQPYMTLDQYYYSSIEDTTERDSDQVVGRFTKVKHDYSPADKTHQDAYQDDSTILVVNQLWLYTLDENTIITFTTRESTDAVRSFFQRVLANLKSQESGTTWSVETVRKILLDTAIGMFNTPEIGRDQSMKKSPLTIFKESIQEVREREALLYRAFCEQLENDLIKESPSQERDQSRLVKLRIFCSSLLKFLFVGYAFGLIPLKKHKEDTSGREKASNLTFEKPDTRAIMATETRSDVGGQTARPRTAGKDDSSRASSPVFTQQYDNILVETTLLRVIKDISDELNMLQSLAEDQEEVCDQLWGEKYDRTGAFTYNTPTEIKAEIEEMTKDAELVRHSLDMLLDLKQKQANISEAKSSRKQSEEAAKQGVAIMVFTLVTIAFLPASFLTSLFALNVSDFPHVGGTVSYDGQWIFPIIFGVSVGVSGVIAVIAFQMTKWSERWKAAKSKLDKDIEAGEQGSQAGRRGIDAHRVLMSASDPRRPIGIARGERSST